jgi:hypothetical protein
MPICQKNLQLVFLRGKASKYFFPPVLSLSYNCRDKTTIINTTERQFWKIRETQFDTARAEWAGETSVYG